MKAFVRGPCPGGWLGKERLLRVLEAKRLDPTLTTTRTFAFDDMERAFQVSDEKLEDVVKVLVTF